MDDCLFCKIVKKDIPAKITYEDEDLIVFPDINPKARVHFLLVPRVHIKSVLDISSEQSVTLTKMLKVVQRLIRDEKLEGAYQLNFNGGRYQHVPHLHWHLLGD